MNEPILPAGWDWQDVRARLRPWHVLVAVASAVLGVVTAIAIIADTATGLLLGALSATLLVALLMTLTHDMVQRVRIGLTGAGVALVLIWLLGFEKDVAREQGLQLLYAYLVVGALLIAAGATLGNRGPRTWLLAVVATIALWVTSALIGLGLIFDELVRELLVAGFVLVAVVVLAFASFALIVLARRSGEYQAGQIIAATKVSDLSLVAVAGIIVTGYGLWYGLIVDPIDDEPVLDSALAIEPMGSVGDQDRFAVTSTVTNPTPNRIELYGSRYRVFQGALRPVDKDLQETLTPTLEACLRAAARTPTASPLCDTLGGLRSPTGARQVEGPVDEISWNRVWSKDYSLVQDGELWAGGVILEPGSSAEVSFVVLVESGADIVKYEQIFVYGLAHRVEALDSVEAADAASDLAQNCTNNSQEYRIVAIDPVTSLINATEPVHLLVGSDPVEMKLAVCRLTNRRWQSDPLAERLGLGHHRLTYEFVYPFEPVRQPQPSPADLAAENGATPPPGPASTPDA